MAKARKSYDTLLVRGCAAATTATMSTMSSTIKTLTENSCARPPSSICARSNVLSSFKEHVCPSSDPVVKTRLAQKVRDSWISHEDDISSDFSSDFSLIDDEDADVTNDNFVQVPTDAAVNPPSNNVTDTPKKQGINCELRLQIDTPEGRTKYLRALLDTRAESTIIKSSAIPSDVNIITLPGRTIIRTRYDTVQMPKQQAMIPFRLKQEVGSH